LLLGDKRIRQRLLEPSIGALIHYYRFDLRLDYDHLLLDNQSSSAAASSTCGLQPRRANDGRKPGLFR
jgi:hypothetical protein